MRVVFAASGALHSGQSVVGTWWHGVFSAGTHVAGPSLCRVLPSVVAHFASILCLLLRSGSSPRCNEGPLFCFGRPPQRAVCSCYLVARGLFGPNSCCGAEFVQIPAFCGSSFSLTFDFLVLPPLQEYAQTRPHNMSPGQKDPVQPQTAGNNYRLPAVEVRKEAFLAYFGVDSSRTRLL